MASTHVNFRIKKDEKELIDLINSQSNLSDYLRDLLKRELANKQLEKDTNELKKELDSVNLKLDTLQQSVNMLTMLLSSNNIQIQTVQQLQTVEPVVKEEVDERFADIDKEAFDFFD